MKSTNYQFGPLLICLASFVSDREARLIKGPDNANVVGAFSLVVAARQAAVILPGAGPPLLCWCSTGLAGLVPGSLSAQFVCVLQGIKTRSGKGEAGIAVKCFPEKKFHGCISLGSTFKMLMLLIDVFAIR